MASTSKCQYCGGIVLSNEKECPHCGASNLNYVEDHVRTIMSPSTIEELREYCAERGMPLYRMRFFIGEDFKEPRAFGIYKKEDGTVVVYKNKDTGERAIRYEGPDEALGVQELYLKLLDECHRRGIYPDTPDGKAPKSYSRTLSPVDAEQNKRSISLVLKFFGGWFGFVISFVLGGIFGPWITIIGSSILVFLLMLALKKIYDKKHEKDEPTTFGFLASKGIRRIAIISVIVVIIINTMVFVGYKYPSGYYQSDHGIYYHLGSKWYEYSVADSDWVLSTTYDDCDFSRDNGYAGEWNSDWGETAYRFENTSIYSDYQSSHESSGGGYDSWDSGGTDWSSDWSIFWNSMIEKFKKNLEPASCYPELEGMTDFSNLFANCDSTVDISTFSVDTKNVTDMSDLFKYCENFESIDFSASH